jgi:hypothetical protein
MDPAYRDDVALNCIQRDSDRGRYGCGNASAGSTGQKWSTLSHNGTFAHQPVQKRGFLGEIYGIGRDANITYVKHNPGAIVQILFT